MEENLAIVPTHSPLEWLAENYITYTVKVWEELVGKIGGLWISLQLSSGTWLKWFYCNGMCLRKLPNVLLEPLHLQQGRASCFSLRSDLRFSQHDELCSVVAPVVRSVQNSCAYSCFASTEVVSFGFFASAVSTRASSQSSCNSSGQCD